MDLRAATRQLRLNHNAGLKPERRRLPYREGVCAPVDPGPWHGTVHPFLSCFIGAHLRSKVLLFSCRSETLTGTMTWGDKARFLTADERGSEAIRPDGLSGCSRPGHLCNGYSKRRAIPRLKVTLPWDHPTEISLDPRFT